MIGRYAKDQAFSPDALEAMGEAQRISIKALDLGSSQGLAKEMVAQLIVAAASRDRTLGARALSDRAVAAFVTVLRAASGHTRNFRSAAPALGPTEVAAHRVIQS